MTASVKGIGRFEQEAPFRKREAYKSTSSLANGGRKSPLKLKNFEEIQPINVSFMIFENLWGFFCLFSDFFGLAKYGSPDYCAPSLFNTFPTVLKSIFMSNPTEQWST